jgi:uncharacterized protein (TIGR03435 family)
MARRKWQVGLAAVVVLAAQVAFGQVAATANAPGAGTALAAYDVVSVKPVHPDRILFMGVQTSPDGIDGENVTVAMLVQSAYGGNWSLLPTDDAVSGLPDWGKSDRFTVMAKMNDAQMAEFAKLSKDEKDHQRAVMLQALLADRFKLQAHRETRQVLGYELVVAKGGPKFTDKTDADTPVGPNGRPLPNSMRIVPSNGGSEVIVQNYTMEQLAMLLSGNTGVDHRVADKTGVTGKHNYTLTFALPQGVGQAGGPTDAAAPDPAPTLFNALEDQLGLHLQRGTEMVDVVVVDHVERPAAN